MLLNSPVSEDEAWNSHETSLFLRAEQQLLTPPAVEPLNSTRSPNEFEYYSKFLNKNNFNSLLTHCAANLICILYPKCQFLAIHPFICEILRRSKALIILLQLTCYYLAVAIKVREPLSIKDERKLFLGMLIIASKFHQDHNYTFQAWLKICGTNGKVHSIQGLRRVERECLLLLDYSCYLNGEQYENWCNVLVIFGYDFVARHFVGNDNNLILWKKLNKSDCLKHFSKWRRFFERFELLLLNSAEVNFDKYFVLQLGRKFFILDHSFMVARPIKRIWEQNSPVKRARIA